MLAAPDDQYPPRPLFDAKTLHGPKYDGKTLHEIIKYYLKGKKLHETLTNLVIPTFDIKKLQPTLFSSYQTFVAITEVVKQISEGNPALSNFDAKDYGPFLVLSLGTGSSSSDGYYDAGEASKWGILHWFLDGGHGSPLTECFSQASVDMIDYHISVLFKPHDYSGDNYLRIDDVGNKLLTLPVSRKNFDTGKLEPTGDQTNQQALDREDTELGGQKIVIRQGQNDGLIDWFSMTGVGWERRSDGAGAESCTSTIIVSACLYWILFWIGPI
ncbi:hypothetical protein FEM48_ZijujUnG0008200 [Ziziphus jujuba var. spinosa]|uniref:Uncharacterized protein n=1 Tax=Ziziphus jujuba var. spinosa TaxID=714518 RepID=A0A978UA02_ZIZJJ|nr:hypothetical protein FEM48_ZijujUnG0008200 [Ziziphus jujuba var. spinosa]